MGGWLAALEYARGSPVCALLAVGSGDQGVGRRSRRWWTALAGGRGAARGARLRLRSSLGAPRPWLALGPRPARPARPGPDRPASSASRTLSDAPRARRRRRHRSTIAGAAVRGLVCGRSPADAQLDLPAGWAGMLAGDVRGGRCRHTVRGAGGSPRCRAAPRRWNWCRGDGLGRSCSAPAPAIALSCWCAEQHTSVAGRTSVRRQRHPDPAPPTAQCPKARSCSRDALIVARVDGGPPTHRCARRLRSPRWPPRSAPNGTRSYLGTTRGRSRPWMARSARGSAITAAARCRSARRWHGRAGAGGRARPRSPPRRARRAGQTSDRVVHHAAGWQSGEQLAAQHAADDHVSRRAAA